MIESLTLTGEAFYFSYYLSCLTCPTKSFSLAEWNLSGQNSSGRASVYIFFFASLRLRITIMPFLFSQTILPLQPQTHLMHRIAIFASGQGSNARNFVEYFKNRKDIVISLIVSNKKDAGVIQMAKEAGIETLIVDKETLYHSDRVVEELKNKADFIVLAGFLWMIPENIIVAFQGRMVNIHPALLPNYGGKGMYGDKVHEAVIANKEKQSGITIHYVNNKYDEGKIIFQATCEINPADTAVVLAQKIHLLEYKFYPQVVEKLLLGNIS